MEKATENVENTPFKTFESEEELTNFINEKVTLNEQKFKTKIEGEIKEKLEKEAQLSAEEKLSERIKELETEKKAVIISKNKVSAERKFAQSGFEEKDYKDFLEFIVNDDETTTLNHAEMLIKSIEAAADRKIKNTMKDVAKPENNEVKYQNSNETIAQKLGKTASETHKTALETLKKYL